MKKPLIGITPQLNENGDYVCRHHYIDCVLKAGGMPLVLPLDDVESAVDLCDGFLFSGGPDIDPQIFGEEKLECCGRISAPRDQYELSLLPVVLQRSKPILAICRGIQVLNVALGGTLYQDLPAQRPSGVCHRMTVVSSDVIHGIEIIDNTPLRNLLGREHTMVNSYHHQAIKDLGDGLDIAALSEDGVIEGVYLTTQPFCLGLQWHPERLEGADTDRIFRALVDFASK